MATLYISETDRMATDMAGNVIPIAKGETVAEQAVAFTTSTQSSAFNGKTKYVRLQSDTACYVKFGASPTAVSGASRPLAANAPEHFSVEPGSKVAVVT